MTDDAGPTADLASTGDCLAGWCAWPPQGLERSQEMTWVGLGIETGSGGVC